MTVKMNKGGNESSLFLILGRRKKQWKGFDGWIWLIRIMGEWIRLKIVEIQESRPDHIIEGEMGRGGEKD